MSDSLQQELARCDAALARRPDDAEAWKAHGNALLALQRPEAALASYESALALAPDHAAANYNRGLVLLGLRRPVEALAAFDRVLAQDPADAEVLVDRGNALRELARPADALASYDRALACAPDSLRVLHNRGLLLLELERFEEAFSAYTRATAIAPEDAALHVYAGIAALALGRAEDALASNDRALAFDPDDPVALNNRGNALRSLQRPADALASFERGLAAAPAHAGLINNRGNALRELGRYEEALASFDAALALAPDTPEMLVNRGHVLRELRRYDAAARAYARLVEIAPDYPDARGDLVNCMQESCDWRDLAPRIADIERAVGAGGRVVLPFPFLAMSHSPAAQLQCARAHAARQHAPAPTPPWTGRHRHERVRIAYLSADFREHALSYLMAGLFESHDRQRFETTAIAFGPDARDAMRDRLERAFDRFVDARSPSDADVARLLREMEIDIAIDLTGYTAHCRPGILAQRAAPVQVSYLGYPGTLGQAQIDYLIADAFVIPHAYDACYAEKIVRLPDTFQVNDAKRAIAERTPGRADVGLPEAGFVFCCFNHSYKITPQLFDLWMGLLRAVDGSVLWLLGGSGAIEANLRGEAQRRGVAASRLVFAPRLAYSEHLARYRLADVFLDTLPFNAGTTASDALWAGLPVVTCAGEAFAARMAGSLLHAVGLPELVTGTLDAYAALVLSLATDAAKLAKLRRRLADNRANCPLFDTDRFRRHLERAYTLMWERHQRGLPPAAIDVPELD